VTEGSYSLPHITKSTVAECSYFVDLLIMIKKTIKRRRRHRPDHPRNRWRDQLPRENNITPADRLTWILKGDAAVLADCALTTNTTTIVSFPPL